MSQDSKCPKCAELEQQLARQEAITAGIRTDRRRYREERDRLREVISQATDLIANSRQGALPLLQQALAETEDNQ